MKRRACLFLVGVLTLICLLSWGCDLTLGPKVKTVYTVVFPGKPLEILEPVKVRGKVLGETGDPVVQNVGGWVVMPPEHWDAVQRALNTKKE
jgi:hypothetical protein